MLAFARRQELRPTGVDLAAVVRGMQDLLLPSLGPGIALETRFLPEVRPAHTDPNQIETALLNLVVNARDAMPDGGRISIEVLARDFADREMGLPAGPYVCLSVRDTGAGMDEETLSHAAEPFFTTKGIGKGTGLGLSMVHGLAEQSGGRLILRSRPGAGTTVELWLPAAESVGPPAETRGEAATAPHPEGLRVLAVDDDPLVLMNTVAMLEDLGHTVLEARTGVQALNLVKSGETVDVVITDHAMPQMTGAELAEALRAERPGLPVVMATGYAEMPAGVAEGTVRLAKPFRQQELAEALRSVMSVAAVVG
jgi:CheY-like chemotaxis protein/two-component sensor histidine kinase